MASATSATSATSVRLIIDSREHALIDLMKSTEDVFEIQTLPLGDIQIIGPKGQNFLLERKTHLDLASSLADGRFKNQKDRLLKAIQMNPSLSIAYILEGNHSLGADQLRVDKHGRITNGQLRSLIVSMTLKSRIPIIPTGSLPETILYIQKIVKKLTDDSDFISIPIRFSGEVVDITETDKATPVFMSKKDTINRNTFILQCKMLTCLGGMSMPRAEAVLTTLEEHGSTLFTIGCLPEEDIRDILETIRVDNKRFPKPLMEELIRVILRKDS